MSGLAQEQGELEQFQNSLEGRLVGVTTQELQDEIYRRVFEEFNGSLERLRDMLDRYVAPF